MRVIIQQNIYNIYSQQLWKTNYLTVPLRNIFSGNAMLLTVLVLWNIGSF